MINTSIIKFSKQATLLAILGVLFFTQISLFEASAQTESAVAVAEVTLGDVSVVKGENNKHEISFTLVNHSTMPQSDVRFGLDVVVEDEDGNQTATDFVVASEVLTLYPNQPKAVKLVYDASGLAEGEYSLWLNSKTKSGLVLAVASAGPLSVSDFSGVTIDTASCYLAIAGEETKYHILQGVDVAPAEEMTLHCSVVNAGGDVSVTPELATYKRTIYGDTSAVPVSLATLSLKAGETKDLAVTIAKADAPQAYDFVMSLKGQNGATVSNKILGHYVIQGQSSTIQNVNFDKTHYFAGEMIGIELHTTGSADGAYDARATASTPVEAAVEVAVTDGEGMSCGQPVKVSVVDLYQKLTTVAEKDCIRPKANITLLSADGVVLDSSSISIDEDTSIGMRGESTENSARKELSTMFLVITVIVVSLLIALLIVVARKRPVAIDQAAKFVIFGAVALGGFMGAGVDKAEAVNWTHTWSNSEGTHHHAITMTIIDADNVFVPGELININSTINNADCANNSIPIHRLTALLMSGATTLATDILSENPTANTVGTKYGSAVFTAPAPGNYVIRGHMITLNRNEVSYRDVPIRVACPAGTTWVTNACVANPPAASAGITATCSASNGPVALSWSAVTGATHYALRVDYPGDPAPHLVQQDNVAGTSYNSFVPNTGVQYSAWVHACNAGGCSAPVTTSFTCNTAPTVTLNATPSLVGPGNSSNLTWTTSGATSCTASGGWSGNKSTTGGTESVSPSSPTTYTLSCTGPGGTANASANVNLPSGRLSAGTCEIPLNSTSCDVTVDWSSANFLGSRSVSQGGAQFSTSASGLATRAVTPDDRTFTLRDNGSTYSLNAVAGVTCAGGGVWVGNTCMNLPVIAVVSNPDIVRKGDTAPVSITVTSTSNLNCSVTGAVTDSFTHTGGASAVTYPFTSEPLTSARLVEVTCTHPTYPEVTGSASARINVIPSIEEI